MNLPNNIGDDDGRTSQNDRKPITIHVYAIRKNIAQIVLLAQLINTMTDLVSHRNLSSTKSDVHGREAN